MTFTHPGWLGAGVIACLWLLFLAYRYDRRQQAALAQFVSAHLRVQLTQSLSVGRRRVQRGLFLLAVALLCVALAGPQWGFRWEQISRRGNEIVFAVDTSRSMTTPDVKPDRLSRAKLAIDDFLKQLDGDAVGLVAFAGTGFLVCPITLDYGAFHESLSALDTNIIPRGGTNIASAIRTAQAALRRRPGSDKILILVTDGEDLEGNALTAAQAAANEDKLRIYTVGVGTANGDLIPLTTAQGNGFVKDDSGNFVKSHLDEATLKAIAEATGGFYTPLGQQGEGLVTLYNTALGPLAKHELASRQQKIYTQRFQWPLAASLIALLSSLLIGTRRPTRATSRSGVPATTATTAAAAAGLMTVLLAPLAAPPARADVAGGSLPDPGQKIPARAMPPPAAAADVQPKEPLRQYNAGTAAYKAGQFPQAAKAFQESISRVPSNDAKRLADQQDAYYNLGNALYRTGQKSGQGAPQETLKNWQAAVKAYDTALQLRADDADSKFNRDFVQHKIDELQQQQQQNQQNKQNQKDQKDQKNSPGQQGQQPQQAGSQQNDPKQGDKPGDAGQQPSASNPDGSPPQPKPGQAGQQPATEPPPAANQPKPAAGGGDGKPAPAQPQGQKQPQGNPDQQADADARQADNEHQPGQMSREEARELLDSVKGEERQALGTPLARSDSDSTSQDQPLKDW